MNDGSGDSGYLGLEWFTFTVLAGGVAAVLVLLFITCVWMYVSNRTKERSKIYRLPTSEINSEIESGESSAKSEGLRSNGSKWHNRNANNNSSQGIQIAHRAKLRRSSSFMRKFMNSKPGSESRSRSSSQSPTSRQQRHQFNINVQSDCYNSSPELGLSYRRNDEDENFMGGSPAALKDLA